MFRFEFVAQSLGVNTLTANNKKAHDSKPLFETAIRLQCHIIVVSKRTYCR